MKTVEAFLSSINIGALTRTFSHASPTLTHAHKKTEIDYSTRFLKAHSAKHVPRVV
jgi:hypothetical protein